ncbi:MAG: hypothetical protein AB1646_03740 [Thermodesulfobacteriota bacterium]
MSTATETFRSGDAKRFQRWERIRHEHRVFLLRKPVDVEVWFDDGLWKVRCDALGISGYAEDYQEALETFESDFGDCWDCIATEDDDQLGADALALKRGLLDIVDTAESPE